MDQIIQSSKQEMVVVTRSKVMVKDGCVVYINCEGNVFNVPQCNTIFVLLAEGTSITNDAVRLLSENNVTLLWVSAGATQPYAITSPTSNYRPTKYMQSLCSFWFDEVKRLCAAKWLMQARVDYVEVVSETLKGAIDVDDRKIQKLFNTTRQAIVKCNSVQELLGVEGNFVKKLYQAYANEYAISFTRDTKDSKGVNGLLTKGNYYAYGTAASSIYTLGLDNSFPFIHGKTRKGGLVFDVADIVKTAVILPLAFKAYDQNLSSREYKQLCVETFAKYKVHRYNVDTLKNLLSEFSCL
ncbi:CRISPR associated protein Cas1 [Vibrio phage 1.161.O._10N.261.48.C5]|nr:CRISPR associated protein Cas1 [Vibrio phage 1.161.O._10N.261.48.C5]